MGGSEANRNHSYCGLQCYCRVYTSEFWPTNYSFTQRGYRVVTGLQCDGTSTGEHPRLAPVRCVGLPTLLELPRFWSGAEFFPKKLRNEVRALRRAVAATGLLFGCCGLLLNVYTTFEAGVRLLAFSFWR